MNNSIKIEGKDYDKANIKYLTELVDNEFKMITNNDSVLYTGYGEESRDSILEELGFNKPISSWTLGPYYVVNENQLISIYHNIRNPTQEKMLQYPAQFTFIKKHIAYISLVIVEKNCTKLLIKSYTGHIIDELYNIGNYNQAQILREKILDCLR